jgi:flagellar basal-body rod protein FlgB
MIYRQFLFKNRIPLMNKGLDAYALRQKVIAKNVANSTTPHYKPEQVKFEELLNDSQITAKGIGSDERHIPIGTKDVNDVETESSQAKVPEPEVYFSGESHVNIDKEMSNLAQSQIKFRFASQMVKTYFQGMQYSITGQRS